MTNDTYPGATHGQTTQSRHTGVRRLPDTRHGYAVVAGLAGAAVTTLADAGTVAAAAVGVGVVAAALYWHRHDETLRRRAVTATLTTVGALAAAGWGVVLGEAGRFAATPLSSALLVTATAGTGVAVLAGAGAGYYGARLADSPADTPGDDATSDGPGGATDATSDDPAAPDTAPGRADEAGGRVAEQKRAFYFLNNLLRHHVLNGLNVVDGYAARLADGEADTERAAGVIRERVATMTTVVGNVRAVADVFAGDPELTVTDVGAVAARVRDRAADRHPAATVTVAADGPTEVWSAGGADAVVWELVDNGIVHNDGDAPEVHVRVTETDDAVWVHVADDGPGVDSPTETLLSPGTTGDQGLGLYLVATLVRYARGEVRVGSPERPVALPGVAPDDDRLAALLAADGTCVSLRFVPAAADRPEPSPADRAVEHAIDRPQRGDGA